MVGSGFGQTELSRDPCLFRFVGKHSRSPYSALRGVLRRGRLVDSGKCVYFSTSPVATVGHFFRMGAGDAKRPVCLP